MGGVERQVGRKHLSSDELEHRALTLQALGWLLLAFDGIVAVFMFVGIRDGSLLWLIWTLIEGALGLGFVVAGLHESQRAAATLRQSGEPHRQASNDAQHRRAA
jgi:hypothetical protein